MQSGGQREKNDKTVSAVVGARQRRHTACAVGAEDEAEEQDGVPDEATLGAEAAERRRGDGTEFWSGNSTGRIVVSRRELLLVGVCRRIAAEESGGGRSGSAEDELSHGRASPARAQEVRACADSHHPRTCASAERQRPCTRRTSPGRDTEEVATELSRRGTDEAADEEGVHRQVGRRVLTAVSRETRRTSSTSHRRRRDPS